MDENSILDFLDNAYEAIEMPCLGNMNIDYLVNRLSVYRSDHSWFMLFNSAVWWPAGRGLDNMIELVGPGVVGRAQGFVDDCYSRPPGAIELGVEGRCVAAVTVRDQEIDLSTLNISPNYSDNWSELGFRACVALLEKHREFLLASSEEVSDYVPDGFRHLLTIDEWDHPDAVPPSGTHTFPLLAKVIVAEDTSLWQPPEKPNTHWSHWLPK